MSRKKMTVELEKPFVWPEEPEDLSPYVLQAYTLKLSFSSRSPVSFLNQNTKTNNSILQTDGNKIPTTVQKKCKKTIPKVNGQKPLPRNLKNDGKNWKSKRRNYKRVGRLGLRRGRRWG